MFLTYFFILQLQLVAIPNAMVLHVLRVKVAPHQIPVDMFVIKVPMLHVRRLPSQIVMQAGPLKVTLQRYVQVVVVFLHLPLPMVLIHLFKLSNSLNEN